MSVWDRLTYVRVRIGAVDGLLYFGDSAPVLHLPLNSIYRSTQFTAQLNLRLNLLLAMDLSKKRKEYELGAIDIESVARCPIKQFESWFQEASDSDIPEPNAMVLSTVDADGGPSQRTVLLKYFDRSGFVFFTNYSSRKAKQIANNSRVSLLFPWYALQRQVEIDGSAEKISTTESLKYFTSRPRGSQLGAWVSRQSSVVSARSVLRNKLAEFKQKFSSGLVPMPSFWGGYRVKPNRIEFWQGGLDRLHDRIEYRVESDDEDTWHRQRLAP